LASSAHHRAQQLGGLGLGDQTDVEIAVRHGRQKAGLDFGRVIYAGRYAVGDQVEQIGAVRCVLRAFCGLDQLDQVGGLRCSQRQRRDAEGGAFSNMLAVGLQHLVGS
jgi:hypothetical protein